MLQFEFKIEIKKQKIGTNKNKSRTEEHADDACDVATHLLIWQTSPS